MPRYPARGYTEGCRLFHSVDQSIANGNFIYLHFDTEDYDTDGMHELLIDDTRITIKTNGIYLFTAHFYFASNDVGWRRGYITISARGNVVEDRRLPVPGTLSPLHLTTIDQVTAGQYAQVRVWQNSGDALDVTHEHYRSPCFMAQRVG